jgi:hypothetical protein
MKRTAGKQQRGRPFKPGVSGNASGRPTGSRNRATVMAEAISEEDALAITRSVVSKATKGDMTAARIVLDRLWPPARGRAISMSLPPVDDAAGVLAAHGALIKAITEGLISVEEASALSQLLTAQSKAIESTETEARLRAIEEQIAALPNESKGQREW